MRTLAPIEEEFFRIVGERLIGREPFAYRDALQEVIVGIAADRAALLGLDPGPLGGISALPGFESAELGRLYQLALEREPEMEPSASVRWASSRERKRRGAFYTPEPLVRRLVEFAVGEFVLAGRDPLSLRVCDPACGDGRFLLAAARRLANAHSEKTGLGHNESLQLVARNCLFGVDSDPIAALLGRIELWLATGAWLEGRIVCADALLDDWSAVLPEGEFDAVIGNPPFGNVVEGGVPAKVKAARKERYPELRGTADLSAYFASLACRLVAREGRVGLVVPRAFLCAGATEALRLSPPNGLSLVSLDESDDDHFAGADVFVALVGFVRTNQGPALESTGSRRLQTEFEVRSSMTVAEAYETRADVVDSVQDDGYKLVTTGLIEPGKLLWGERACRYLHAALCHPRISRESLPPGRQALARRPKVLVAGLSRRVEAYLDAQGACCGAVGTYTITHPENDVRALQAVTDLLNGPEATARLQAELGPSALRGGSITVTKRFLCSLPLERLHGREQQDLANVLRAG